jgi:hypothetical protein
VIQLLPRDSPDRQFPASSGEIKEINQFRRDQIRKNGWTDSLGQITWNHQITGISSHQMKWLHAFASDDMITSDDIGRNRSIMTSTNKAAEWKDSISRPKRIWRSEDPLTYSRSPFSVSQFTPLSRGDITELWWKDQHSIYWRHLSVTWQIFHFDEAILIALKLKYFENSNNVDISADHPRSVWFMCISKILSVVLGSYAAITFDCDIGLNSKRSFSLMIFAYLISLVLQRIFPCD